MNKMAKSTRAYVISCFSLFLVDFVLAFLQQKILYLRFGEFPKLNLSLRCGGDESNIIKYLTI